MLNILDIQKRLVAVAMPSGFERRMGEVIAEIAKPYSDEMYFDTLGNLIVRKKGPGKKVMIPAHMDTIGFMVTYIDKNGFIYFDTLGSFTPPKLVGTTVRFKNNVRGCIGLAYTKDKRTVAECRITDLFIDIGARDEAEARSLIKIGDVAVYAGEPSMVAGGNIAGPYADDLIGCTILLCVLSEIKNPTNDLYFVFTVQEEVGLRGATTAAYGIEPDFGFCIDVTPTGDTPEASYSIPLSIGKGPAIKIRDSEVICNPQVIELITNAAEKANIEYQIEILRSGGTDAGAMHRARGGVLSGAISIPTRYIHTPNEMFNMKDVEDSVKLVIACVAEELKDM